MKIDSYVVCKQIANSLKSIILAGNEINEVQLYSDANFGGKCGIYNQIAVNKKKYTKPYIAVNEIGQNQRQKSSIQIDIDFSIPIDSDEEIRKEGIAEEVVDGVIEYKNYYKLSEFADKIIGRIETTVRLIVIPLYTGI